jgi:putative flippase GtrA
MNAPRTKPSVLTFLRSLLAGGAATLADLATIGVLVGLAHVDPRVANVPALVVGAVVQFFGNRHFAFRAAKAPMRRQAALFAATEAIAFALNATLYHLVASAIVLGPTRALVARAVTTNIVFLAWSYPAFRRVFRANVAAASS